jgi:hypothetical protein
VRALVLSAAGVIINLALNITLAKYGAEVPDWAIVSLWLLPIIPLCYWVYTHEKLLRHRQWIEGRFRTAPITSSLQAAGILAILVICVSGVWYTLAQRVTRRRLEMASNNSISKPLTNEPQVKAQIPPPQSPPVHKSVHRIKPQPPATQSLATPNTAPMTQECAPGANCAMSNGQSGGITAGKIEIGVGRRIPETDKGLLVQMLSSSRAAVTIRANMEDEPLRFAEDWKELLIEAGWTVFGVQQVKTDTPFKGVYVTIPGEASKAGTKFEVFHTEPAYYLGNALQREGVSVNGHRDPSMQAGSIDLYIGQRP